MENFKNFDKEIKQALEGLNIPMDGDGSWDMLEEKMNQSTANAENAFDEVARGAMAGFNVKYDESTWSMLSDKIDLANSVEVDAAAKTALKDLRVPYDATSWSALSERLDRMSYRRRLIASKVFEAAVILLAVFTMVKFLGQIPEVREMMPGSMVQSYRSGLEGTNMLDLESEDPVREEPVDLSELLAGNISVEKDAVVALGIDKVAKKGDKIRGNQVQMQRAEFVPAFVPHDFVNSHEDLRKEEAVLPVEVRGAEISEKPRTIKVKQAVAAVPVIPGFSASMLQAETATAFHIVAADRIPKVETTIGVFYQGNKNLINNLGLGGGPGFPIDQEQTALSQGFGLAANIQFGKVGFDLGFAYDHLEYNAAGGQNEVHKIQLPLHLRYNSVESKFADVYVKGGASVHGAMNAYYQSDVQASQSSGNNRNSAKYNDGLLSSREGFGTSRENIYLTLDLGFGVDVPLGKSFSLLSEFLMQRRIKGELGYTEDKLNTFATKVGIAYTF